MAIKAPKGTKDMLPQDAYKWQFIEKEWAEICKEYGIKCLYSDFFEKDTLIGCTLAPASNITINHTGGLIQTNDYPKISY